MITVGTTRKGNIEDHQYSIFIRIMNSSFIEKSKKYGNIFKTDVDPDELWDAYISSFPGESRQHHNCNTCRSFIKKYGSLAFISDDGMLISAMWNKSSECCYFDEPIKKMDKMIRRSSITGVFYDEKEVWGIHETGAWSHYYIIPGHDQIHKNIIKTPHQSMAEKLEDFKTIKRALAEFSIENIETAIDIIKADVLYRSEKIEGQAKFLYDLHSKIKHVKGSKTKNNIIWKFVASAPSGFCHPRTSMIGTLLEDIKDGLDFKSIQARFSEKMSPLLYRRPQSLPTSGNIEQAERIVEKLGIASSLKRRFAMFHEIEKIWVPKEGKNINGGVFSNLKTKNNDISKLELPPISITWEKFKKTVLEDAITLEYYVPSRKENYTAILTAEDPTAPPIIQWDKEDKRNPFSTYVWFGGSYPIQWGLDAQSFAKISCISLNPSMWFDGYGQNRHHGECVIFILEGARETRQSGLALFPEILKSELHPIRSTIEAFSKNGKISCMENASACGLAINNTLNKLDIKIRVTTNRTMSIYIIDRFN